MGSLRIWPSRNQPLTFLLGMDTLSAANLVPPGAWVLLQNCALSTKGSASKRLGYATYGGTLGTSCDMGMYELVTNNGTSYLLRVGDDGKLYKKNGDSWTKIPIRIATPYGVTATNGASGSVGANLASSTKYQYAFVAVRGSGAGATYTLDSTNISSTSGEVTTGATAYPVTATAKGAYGADTYEVWRRTYSGSWGSWGRLTTGLTHSTTDAVTTVSHTDDGNTAPDTAVTLPASNDTDYTMSTSNRADWVTSRKSGDNVAFFINGTGLAWTDGTNAQLLQPATETALGASLSTNRWWDVTDAIYTCRALHVHHTYPFLTGAQDEPIRMYWCDVDQYWEYSPPTAIIVDTYAAGGKIMDFATKDDALVIGTSVGVDVLWGRSFDTTSLGDGTVYFSHASDFGVSSRLSMTKGPDGSVLYLDQNARLREIVALSAVREQVVERELPGGQAIRPTLATMSDKANAAAHYDGDQLYLSFPSDNKVVRIYFFGSSNTRIDAPVLDELADGITSWLALQDGTLIGSDNDTGQLYEMYKAETLTDNATAITMKIESGIHSMSADTGLKEFLTIYSIVDIADGYSLTINCYAGDGQTESVTATTSVTGADGYAVAEGSADGAEYDSSSYSRATLKVLETDIEVEGHNLKVDLTNDSSTEKPIIHGLYFEFVTEGRASGEE